MQCIEVQIKHLRAHCMNREHMNKSGVSHNERMQTLSGHAVCGTNLVVVQHLLDGRGDVEQAAAVAAHH